MGRLLSGLASPLDPGLRLPGIRARQQEREVALVGVSSHLHPHRLSSTASPALYPVHNYATRESDALFPRSRLPPSVEGVVYVVDPGLVKQKSYVPSSGMDSLDVVPISRVQATQRAGRAGRTRPGKVRVARGSRCRQGGGWER